MGTVQQPDHRGRGSTRVDRRVVWNRIGVWFVDTAEMMSADPNRRSHGAIAGRGLGPTRANGATSAMTMQHAKAEDEVRDHQRRSNMRAGAFPASDAGRERQRTAAAAAVLAAGEGGSSARIDGRARPVPPRVHDCTAGAGGLLL